MVRTIGRSRPETLAALAPGTSGRVKRIDHRRGGSAAERLRLMELGFVPGTLVTAIRRAPFGDPIEVELRGYRLSLRSTDAAAIAITNDARTAPTDYAIAKGTTAPRSIHGAVIGLVGNPNCGKSTLFNALSGASRPTGNYPGITVTRSARAIAIGAQEATLVDLPGCYGLVGRSPDEDVAAYELFGRALSPHAPQRGCDACVVVLDATALARSLYLALAVIELSVPVVCVLNMSDEARAQGIEIDTAVLQDALGVEVIRTVATKHEGLGDLRAALERAIASSTTREVSFGGAIDHELGPLVMRVAGELSRDLGPRRRAFATWLAEAAARGRPLPGDFAMDELDDLAATITAARYGFVDRIVARAVRAPERAARSFTDRIDRLLTHPFTGAVALLCVLALAFNLLFTLSQPMMDGIEALFAWIAASARSALPAHWLSDLVADGLVVGVGTVLMFVPQIALLLFLMSFLEAFGYLSRAAFMIDRLMRLAGLNGKAFVPMLGGYACAVPAIMSLRTLEHRRDRLLTMAVLPLMSCSARLPVYTLVIATLYPASMRWLGMPVSTIILLGLYVASAVTTLLAASFIGRTVFSGDSASLVLELPPYRMPVMRTLLRTVWQRLREFLTTAGTTIVVLSVVMWLLLHFPRMDEPSATESQRLEHSIAGRVGHAIEPVIEPLGFDWRIGIGLIGSFAAREVFVATMGVIHGAANADQEQAGLVSALQNAKRKDGRPIYTPRTGFALLAFFMLACQCMSTLATIRRETRSWRFVAGVFLYMTALAYVVALAINQIGAAIS
ncbi:MAG: ferrous iron transport protein B [Deltaproteobacteria bacterium]|nr:ferrous iron transport protein B [Deltaproteobacteria bacterium]